ncbi:MAG: MFS transporter [Solobacterium sp.]|nr:MFS transporter [Solobacterium sp.]
MSRDQKDTIWTGKFILVLVIAMFSGLAAQLTYPLVARFSLTLNPDITLAGTIAGLMSLMSLFVCPFAGLLSDRFSRKRILQVSSICYAAVLLMHAFIRTIPALIVLRLLVGVFFSINSVTLVAFSTAFIPYSRISAALRCCDHDPSISGREQQRKKEVQLQ